VKPPYVANTRTGIYLITNESEMIQSHLLQLGAFEPAAAKLADAVCRIKDGAVIDVGANIGTFSIHLATLNRDVEILAFEPQRLVYYQLCANVLLNSARNICAFQLAVGSSKGTVDVPLLDPYREKFPGSVTLDPAVAAVRATIPGIAETEPNLRAQSFEIVELATLDELMAGKAVSFMKIDVEGMELAVLQGATAVLDHSRPVIFAEAWDLPQFARHKAAIFDFLQDQRYLVREVGNDFVAVPEEEQASMPWSV
jgi:FkbM family methyltransferase